MMNDESIVEMLKRIQADGAETRRRVESMEVRLSSVEDHMRGFMTSLAGIHADLRQLNGRVSRIKRRLDLVEA
jgi:predicted nuclease with TOPRIM domain